MEFFTWVSVSQAIASLFQPNAGTIDEYIAQCKQSYLIGIPVAAGIFLVCLILGGIGLSAMAKKEGKKNAFLGFLPFANTYYAGEIAGESSFFGQKMKRAGLYAMLSEIACFVLEAFYLIADYVSIPYSVEGQQIVTESGTYTNVEINVSAMPASIRWLAEANVYFYWFSWLLSFVQLIFLCVLFMALFRKYYARRPVLMTVLSALFPFRGFVLFAVRNNTPVDYNEYLRRRAEQFARSNPQNYGGYNGGGYNGGNGGGGYAPPPSGDASDPFGEFGGSSGGGSSGTDGGSSDSGSPFDDF